MTKSGDMVLIGMVGNLLVDRDDIDAPFAEMRDIEVVAYIERCNTSQKFMDEPSRLGADVFFRSW